jgi:peptidoglycan/xylan/chitin deacetylase (PgdA/CDA1 family)
VILAYHGLGTVERRHDPHGMMVSRAAFRQQVALLRSRGYEFVRQAEFAERVRAVSGSPPKTASLTFDDGPEDNATLLPTLLEELEVPATLFVNSGLLGQPYRFLDASTGVRVMDGAQLQAIARHPLIEIGSHTRTHVLLGDATEEQAFAELESDKRELESQLAVEVRSFAYPECVYSPACPAAAKRAGFTNAVTCGGRGGWTPYELPRQSPSPGDGRLAFELKARGHFHRVRSLPPVKVARWATRRRRYGT